MPEDKSDVPVFVKKCVQSVAKKQGGDTDRAFAICVANFQKNGYLKKGTMDPTSKGKKLAKKHEDDPKLDKKLSRYEKYLKKAKDKRNERVDQLSFNSTAFRAQPKQIDVLLERSPFD